ncbi:MAG: inverse autotransporter beta domain-containing protein [Parachlamydiales bacterium]
MRRILLATLLFAAPLVAEECCFAPEVIVSGQGGNYRRGGGIEGWVPLGKRSDRVVFVQGGGGYFRHQGVGSLGLGFRQKMSSKLALGINGFGDLAFTDRGSIFGQLGTGVELLANRALFRANGYFPLSPHRVVSSRPGVAVEGTQLIALTLDSLETPLFGFDTEVGGELNVRGGEFWAYGGYFYYKREGIRPIQGPRIRAEYRYNPRNLPVQLVFGGWYEWDRQRQSTGSAYLEIRYPFCRSTCPASVCDLMGRKVYRERVVWVHEGPRVQVGGPLGQLIFANETIDGIGTQTNPATIDNAFAMSGPGDIVFLLQDTGNMTPSGTITLDLEEKVYGFGDSDQVTITLSNGAKLTITDLTGAGRGVVAGGLLNPIFMTDSDNLVQGVELLGGVVGILQPATFDGLTVKDLILASQTVAGISNTGGAFSVADSELSGQTTAILSTLSSGTQEIRRSSFQGARGIRFDGAQVDQALVSQCAFAVSLNAVEVIDSGGPFVVYQSLMNGGDDFLLVDDNANPGLIKDVRVLECEANMLDNRAIEANMSQAADTYVIRNCNFSGSEEMIYFDLNQGPVNIEITENALFSLTQDAIFIDAASTTTILIQDNEGTAGDNFIDVLSRGGVNVPLNVTLLSNVNLNTPPAESYSLRRNAMTTQFFCATLLDNGNVTASSGILLSSNANNIFVFDLPNLSANNNNLSVTTVGSVANTDTRCTLPTIPPLPFTP